MAPIAPRSNFFWICLKLRIRNWSWIPPSTQFHVLIAKIFQLGFRQTPSPLIGTMWTMSLNLQVFFLTLSLSIQFRDETWGTLSGAPPFYSVDSPQSSWFGFMWASSSIYREEKGCLSVSAWGVAVGLSVEWASVICLSIKRGRKSRSVICLSVTRGRSSRSCCRMAFLTKMELECYPWHGGYTPRNMA